MTRPLRVLLVANDGRSGGHVVRALAVARALRRQAEAVRLLLATTSEAESLLAFGGIPFVRLPAPHVTRDAGWEEAERRELVTRALLGIADGFRPDVLVVDTFPSGPHLEVAPLLGRVRHRVLVRRHVRVDRERDTEAAAGLDAYRLVLLPADPGPRDEPGAAGTRIPPITLLDPAERLPRAEARAALGFASDDRVALLSCGAGGDAEAPALLSTLERLVVGDGRFRPFVAYGPLAKPSASPSTSTSSPGPAPLQRFLAAFDAAIVAAGYNSAHECVAAGIPTVLFARLRAFDDQAARVARFAALGLARELPAFDEAVLAAALSGATGAIATNVPSLATDGADAAARAIRELVS